MSVKKTILLLPRHPTSWRKLFDIALLMNESSGLRPVVVLASMATAAYADECRQYGIEHIALYPQIERRVQEQSPFLISMLAKLDRWLAGHDRLANGLLISLFRILEMRRPQGL